MSPGRTGGSQSKSCIGPGVGQNAEKLLNEVMLHK